MSWYRVSASRSFGDAVASGHGYSSTASDAGTDLTASSGVLVDDAGDIVLTPTGSTCGSGGDLIEILSTNSLSPAGSFSPSVAPSTTDKSAAVPGAEIEDLLKNEFDNLTFAEKSRALASVGKVQQPSSSAGTSEAETEILTKNNGTKIGEDRDTTDGGKPSLADWQALCKAVGVTVDKMPTSISQCKKTLKKYNTNLADLTDALRTGTVAQTFPSVAALSRYSKREGKIARKVAVKKDPLLKMMLRELFVGGKCKGFNEVKWSEAKGIGLGVGSLSGWL